MRGAAAGVAFAFLALLVGGPGAAQTGGQVRIQLPDSLGLVSDEPMQVPFAPGEELLYEVQRRAFEDDSESERLMLPRNGPEAELEGRPVFGIGEVQREAAI